MENYIDIYKRFRDNKTGLISPIPFITISERATDALVNYSLGNTTYDLLSYKYYGNSLMGSIIQMANPKYIDESEIEDGAVIRIPLPFDEVSKEINDKINQYKIKNNLQ